MSLIAKRFCRSFISIGLISILVMQSSNLYADEKEDLLIIRNTVINLMQQLVDQGVMSPEQARELVETAKQSAIEEVEEIRKAETPSEKAVRVQYVPEIVKEEIREQVRNELRAQVTQDVIKHAQTNRWGIKDALPGWVNRIKLSGDIRLRADGEYLDQDNNSEVYRNVDNEFIDTINDRERARIRMRLAVKAKVNDSIEAGIRLASGNLTDPVSTNQTLGNRGNRYDVTLDRAYLKYTDTNDDGYEWLTLWGGRIPNPWFSTDLVWDSDLNFEGFAATTRYNFAGGDSLYDLTESNKEVFLTMGAFPLDEFSFTANDPWLYGAQIGGSILFSNQSKLKVGVAYYYYDDLVVEPSFDVALAADPNVEFEIGSTSPPEVGQGNTLADLDPIDGTNVVYGYASDYELLGLTTQLDLSIFAPYRLSFTGEYFENIGYDRDDVNRRVGLDVKEETTAYQFRIDFGWPSVNLAGNWRAHAAYKYIERDAVLALFNDSDFHGGGTDAEGYVIGFDYGLGKNAWASFKWISTDEIDGPGFLGGFDCDVIDCSYKYDRVQVDVNAKF